jgi:hypothetical protein
MKGLKKGDLVRTVLWPGGQGNVRYPRGIRTITAAERDWMAQDSYWWELDSAGEPRIIPRHMVDQLVLGLLVTVVRARAKAPSVSALTWAHGHVLVLDPKSGHEYYVKRHYLEAVGDEGSDQ